MHVDLRILRYDPERDRKQHWETYGVECDPKMDRVLDLLHRVKYEQDGSLTFRRSWSAGHDAAVAAAADEPGPVPAPASASSTGPATR